MLLSRPRTYVVLAVLLALALASCGTRLGAGAATAPASPDSTAVPYGLPPATEMVGLHVLRMSSFAQNRVAPFEKTSTDVAEVQRLYAAVLQLKPFPSNSTPYCPVNIGVTLSTSLSATGDVPGAGGIRRRVSRNFDPAAHPASRRLRRLLPFVGRNPGGTCSATLRWREREFKTVRRREDHSLHPTNLTMHLGCTGHWV